MRDDIWRAVSASLERFERLAWPALERGMPGWCDWRVGTEEEDFLGIDVWVLEQLDQDGNAEWYPAQVRMQPNFTEYQTFTLRQAEADRLWEWASSPMTDEPLHPHWWIHGYGDPLRSLFVTTSRSLVNAIWEQRLDDSRRSPYWQRNTQDGKAFAVFDVRDLDWVRSLL